MAVKGATTQHNKVHKRTKQGGQKKTATMNKSEKRTYKK